MARSSSSALEATPSRSSSATAAPTSSSLATNAGEAERTRSSCSTTDATPADAPPCVGCFYFYQREGEQTSAQIVILRNMKRVLAHKKSIAFGLIVIAVVVYFVAKKNNELPTWVTTTVETGTVAEVISVSGVMSAESEATLAFPVAGTVSSILVAEGDSVTAGQVLATLDQAELLADKQNAYGDLLIAQANRTEAVSGPRQEARTVTAATLATAKENLVRIEAEEAKKVDNAYRTLLSTDLEAFPADPDMDDVPPTVSGTYSCNDEGTYTLSVFRSGTKSGHSYKLSGLETGTYAAFTDAPAAFGSCGLSLQFAPGELYSAKDWLIEIPNKRGAGYVTNLNAYELTKKQAENAVAAAKEAVVQTAAESTLENAAPRVEASSRLDAAIIQATARLNAVEARLADRTLRAPFAGVVSAIEMVPGEVAPADAITIVADTRYELTVRIPEIDITTISLGQPAEIVFDAKPEEVITAKIDFISKTATEIDGVAYFEAKIHFDTPPSWFRSGLSADVNIVVDSRQNTLKLPKRFITKTEDGRDAVMVPKNERETTLVPVTVTFTGNDGFAAIDGIAAGTTVVAP